MDSDGFPRADVDIYAVRKARNKIICKYIILLYLIYLISPIPRPYLRHATLIKYHGVYIIVIARLPGIYMYGDVNHPCPRATLLDSDQYIAINPWPHAITI